MAIDLTNGFSQLTEHVGHNLECVTYGSCPAAPPANVAIECVDCSVVLVDIDHTEKAE